MILNQVTIPCIDYAESVAFYSNFGLILIVDSPPRYARFESADGSGATLSLHAVKEVTAAGAVIYFDHESEAALDRHVQELAAQGIVFSSEPQD